MPAGAVSPATASGPTTAGCPCWRSAPTASRSRSRASTGEHRRSRFCTPVGADCSKGSRREARRCSAEDCSPPRSARRSGRAATRSARTSRLPSGRRSASGSCATASSTSGARRSGPCARPVSHALTASTSARRAIPSSSSPSGGRGGRAVRRVSSALSADTVRTNYERIRGELGAGVRIVAAIKYVDLEQLGALAEAGIEVVGENRAQDLEAKHARYGDVFRWHFIGHLQSRKAKTVSELCELCHSLSSESAARKLEIPALVEVNLSDESTKSGIPERDLEDFLALYENVVGLMTMPPATEDPELSRPYFRRLRELAERHGLAELSMGTSQDYRVAADEGATMVRLGSVLYRG